MAQSEGPLILERLSEFHRMPQPLNGQDLRGMEVINLAGNTVGSVSDMFVDAANNEPRFADLEMTGTHGRATREVLVPVEDVEVLNDRQVRVRAVESDEE